MNAKCDDFIFDKIEVGNSVLGSEDGSDTDLYSSVSTKQIRVASGGAICLNSEVFVQKIDIKGTGSVIDGKLTVFDNTTDNAYNRLVINEDSDLTLSKDSETVVKGSGCIEVWDGATLNINGSASLLDGADIEVYNNGRTLWPVIRTSRRLRFLSQLPPSARAHSRMQRT